MINTYNKICNIYYISIIYIYYINIYIYIWRIFRDFLKSNYCMDFIVDFTIIYDVSYKKIHCKKFLKNKTFSKFCEHEDF